MSASGIALWPGRPWPLGATFDGGGTNFALFSAHAFQFSKLAKDGEIHRIPLPDPMTMEYPSS
jgi:glycogen operon protein